MSNMTVSGDDERLCLRAPERVVRAYQRLACIERSVKVDTAVEAFASLPVLEGEAATYIERAADILAVKAAEAIADWLWPSVVNASFDENEPAAGAAVSP